jgi:hypothetical protein
LNVYEQIFSKGTLKVAFFLFFLFYLLHVYTCALFKPICQRDNYQPFKISFKQGPNFFVPCGRKFLPRVGNHTPRMRARSSYREQRDLVSGMAVNVRDLSMGFVGGITGVFTKPVEGAAQEGALGFFKVQLGGGGFASVVDPGNLSRIQDPIFFHPGSDSFPSRIRIKEFKFFNPKNGF